MKNIILLVASFFIASTGLMAQTATKTSATAKTGPAVKFEKLEYNYGTIKQGDKVEYAFEFTSTGTEPLIISQAQGSCGCTVPEWPKHPMKKGESGTIKVTFDSAGKMGMQDKTITITTNAADSPVVLHIKGNIESAALNVAPEARPMEKPQN